MNLTENLCIVGTGSQARYVIENLQHISKYRLLGLVDIENPENTGKKINGFDIKCVLEDINKYFNPENCNVVIAYGNNIKKKEIARFLKRNKFNFASIISPNSYISSYVEIGEGCIINPNVTILPNTIIGNHVIIHSGCVIEHDNEIKDYANIAPGVITAGYVQIGEGCFVYTASSITPKVKIGDWAIIGAGTVVRKNVKEHDVVAGNPAKSINRKRIGGKQE
ncbi:acetyltransferase [candidate division KSB1 bacterium]